MLSERNVCLLASCLVLIACSPSIGQQSPQQRVRQPGAQRPEAQRGQQNQIIRGRTQSAQSQAQPRGTIRDARSTASQAPVGPPAGFQLTAEQSTRIDKMLATWEKQSSATKTFQAEFVRWLYDPVFGPKSGDASRITGGQIRYAAPDRGMIKEDRVAKFDAKKKAAGEKWPFTEVKNAVGEHWVCNGKSVFEFSHQTSQLIETKLPPEMQGTAIADGPLPFMFGAKAATIKQRYWIRELTEGSFARKKDTDPYSLELIPRGRGGDASKVQIQLDAKEFMPQVLVVFDLNEQQGGKSVYKFSERKRNSTANNLANFMNQFVSPRPPIGWTKISRGAGGPPAEPRQAAQPAQSPRK